jgi:DNA-binding SARP family transcriptional activator
MVHLFGDPCVTVDGTRRAIPNGSKHLVVLVALRRSIRRHQASALLWPASDAKRAAGNLRSALWRLRRAGLELFDVHPRVLRLRADVAVDCEHVDEWAQRLITGAAGPEDVPTLPFRPHAVDLLPGWYEHWAIAERERLREHVLRGLEALCRGLTEQGRFGEAIEVGLAAVGAEPLRDTAQRALLAAHVAEGNVAEGRRCLRSYRLMLRRELGVEPSPDLDVVAAYPSAARYAAADA